MQTLTLFVSSPGDVRDERQAVGRIVERLQARYWNFIRLEPVLWEKEPLRATAHFNEELIRPSDCDLFVCILWSRLGSPLPSQFNRQDGTRFDSGTEWELEEATQAYEERAAKDEAKAKPDILVYRRMAEPPPGGDEGAKREQRKKLDSFCERYFFHPDKTIRRAFSPYESVDEFMALFEQHLEKLLLRHIRLQSGLAEESVRPLPLEGSPFKGLGAFEFEDAPLFFGRNRPIAEALAKLKENHAAGHAFLLIYGGSGYGKSSLMRAGLAPRLTADGYLPEVGEWCGTCLLPLEGDAPPLETLARAIVEAVPDLGKLRDTSGKGGTAAAAAPASRKKRRGKPQRVAMPAEPVWDTARLARMFARPEDLVFAIAAIVAALDRVKAGKPAHLLVLVDQLEEIFTAADVTAEMRDAFFHVLAALAMSRRVWVVATMRSEFFPRVPEHRDLFQLVRHGGGYILSPPELPELHQIIRYPALAAGLQFERHAENGRDLSEQIYQDAADAQDALPLLEFTLEELYQRRRENVLTWAAYDELGGLSGAIARRAQETYDALPLEARRDAAQRIFGELVTLDSEGPATRRRAKRAELEAAHPGAAGFLSAFIEAKLLVTASEGGAATVTLAHEALITHWPVLKQWIEDHRDLLLARRRLEDAARLWVDGQRSTKFYLAEGRLAEADRVAGCGVFRLTPDEEELVRLSRLRARRKLRLFQAATAVFAVLAVAAGALGVVARNKQREAEVAETKALDSAAETRRSLAAADFDAAAARVAGEAPDEALPFLLASLEGDPRNVEAQALLLETLRRTTWHFPEISLRHPLPVTRLEFGADRDSLFAATDTASSSEGFNTTLRWDLAKGSIEAMLAPQWGQTTHTLSVSPGGRHAVIQRDYKWIGPTYLCDARTLRRIARLPVSMAETYPATCFAWSPDGNLLAYPARPDDAGPGKAPLVWRIIDAATGRTIREGMPDDEGRKWCAAQLDRQRLRALAEDGTLLELPITPAEQPAVAKIEGGFKWGVFSPDGTQVLGLTADDDPELSVHQVWKIQDDPLTTEMGELAEAAAWADGRSLAERFAWASWPSPFWDDFSERAGELPIALRGDGPRLRMTLGNSAAHEPVAPVRMESRVKCAALSGDRLAVGGSDGLLEIRTLLPVAGHGFPPPAAAPGPIDEDPDAGWAAVSAGAGVEMQSRGMDWQLSRKGGSAVPLEVLSGWTMIMDGAVSSDGTSVVVSGYSSGSGGYSSSGMALADPVTGKLLTDLEPVTEIRSVMFLGDSHRLAALGSTGLLVAEATTTGFRRLATLPVVEALSVHYIADRDLIAVANPGEVALFDGRDFSRVAVLPLVGAVPGFHGWEKEEHAWAWQPQLGWLAYRNEGRLQVWSLAARRAIIGGLATPGRRVSLEFTEVDGVHGIAFSGDFTGRLPLARAAGVTPAELAALRAHAAAVSGLAFATDSRSIITLSASERKARAASADAALLESLLPGAKQALERIASITPREAPPEAWLPLWQRLAGSDADPSVARWAAGLGADHPWYRAFLRGLIGRSDAHLYAMLRGEPGPDWDSPMPEDPDVAAFHRLAGDGDAAARRKRDAWLLLRTGTALAGGALVEEDFAAEHPEIDAEALSKLEPEALAQFRAKLEGEGTRDWRTVLLGEIADRPAALERLERHAAETLAAYETAPTSSNALAHAEALARTGKLSAAAEFLKDKLPEDAELTLAEAHFLLSAGLDGHAPAAITAALERHASGWLWISWLNAAAGEELEARIRTTMNAVDGRGPAAVAALTMALEAENAPAIGAVLQLAKDIPVLIRDFATARVLWLEGRTAEVFGLWPEEFPSYPDLVEEVDLGPWESIVLSQHADDFMAALRQRLLTLMPPENATPEQLRALAETLLDPASTATFGARRVRDAMMACAEVLADDPEASEEVAAMVDRARIAGAPHLPCLRIEARSFMAQGQFTAAYERWLQLLDADAGELAARDFLLAASCLVEDLQDEPAKELLGRGRERFPQDAGYALDAAWLLLTTGHPEDAGMMLEHGFAIPFPEEQKQTAGAMLLCAAEQTGRSERADEALAELIELSPEWGNAESIGSLEWPDDLKQTLLEVVERNQ
jgi:hypothetical protein